MAQNEYDHPDNNALCGGSSDAGKGAWKRNLSIT
jgi:hypothetical protein